MLVRGVARTIAQHQVHRTEAPSCKTLRSRRGLRPLAFCNASLGLGSGIGLKAESPVIGLKCPSCTFKQLQLHLTFLLGSDTFSHLFQD